MTFCKSILELQTQIVLEKLTVAACVKKSMKLYIPNISLKQKKLVSFFLSVESNENLEAVNKHLYIEVRKIFAMMTA